MFLNESVFFVMRELVDYILDTQEQIFDYNQHRSVDKIVAVVAGAAVVDFLDDDDGAAGAAAVVDKVSAVVNEVGKHLALVDEVSVLGLEMGFVVEVGLDMIMEKIMMSVWMKFWS
ncbi:hypothetical protein WICMUC_000769 [Wickerhamomyces mucosus]|uniref:Uncharacterized protein n=1 Tax=Wickerhamomyces mucosus TaxID=1378264 RepID=A0A9P8TIK4_9ASCO|nr:hypothetical protein WICMUC_000769 [Wickerhamomyces mucosus]